MLIYEALTPISDETKSNEFAMRSVYCSAEHFEGRGIQFEKRCRR